MSPLIYSFFRGAHASEPVARELETLEFQDDRINGDEAELIKLAFIAGMRAERAWAGTDLTFDEVTDLYNDLASLRVRSLGMDSTLF